MIQGEDESHVWRLYRRALGQWSSHVSDEMGFGTAGAYANAKLAQVSEANCVVGEVPAERAADLEGYFRQANTRPLAWHLAGAAAPKDMTACDVTLMTLQAAPRLGAGPTELSIIPARASFAHVKEIAAAMSPGVKPDQAGEAAMCHLDDAHVDAALGLSDGRAAAYATVQSNGDVGFVMDFFVLPEFRGWGYGRAVASWIFDVCARSTFRQVYCAVATGEAATFAQRMGFVPAAKTLMYRAAR